MKTRKIDAESRQREQTHRKHEDYIIKTTRRTVFAKLLRKYREQDIDKRENENWLFSLFSLIEISEMFYIDVEKIVKTMRKNNYYFSWVRQFINSFVDSHAKPP